MPKPTRPAPGPNVSEPVPNRNDRVNFAPRGDATMTSLPPAIAGVNANIAYVADALDYVDEQIDAAEQAVEDAAEQVGLAAGQVTAAGEQRELAEAAALTALNAPGTSSTSSTSASIGTGARSLTTQPGKAYQPGMHAIVAAASDPANVWMYAKVTAYNDVNGVFQFHVPVGGAWGAGTYSSWVITLTGPRGLSDLVWTPVTGTTHTAAAWQEVVLRNAAASTVSLPPAPLDGDPVVVRCENGRRDNVVNRNGKTILGQADNFQPDDPDRPWLFIFSAHLDTWRVS